jgi:hypothetical protein
LFSSLSISFPEFLFTRMKMGKNEIREDKLILFFCSLI